MGRLLGKEAVDRCAVIGARSRLLHRSLLRSRGLLLRLRRGGLAHESRLLLRLRPRALLALLHAWMMPRGAAAVVRLLTTPSVFCYRHLPMRALRQGTTSRARALRCAALALVSLAVA